MYILCVTNRVSKATFNMFNRFMIHASSKHLNQTQNVWKHEQQAWQRICNIYNILWPWFHVFFVNTDAYETIEARCTRKSDSIRTASTLEARYLTLRSRLSSTLSSTELKKERTMLRKSLPRDLSYRVMQGQLPGTTTNWGNISANKTVQIYGQFVWISCNLLQRVHISNLNYSSLCMPRLRCIWWLLWNYSGILRLIWYHLLLFISLMVDCERCGKRCSIPAFHLKYCVMTNVSYC